MENKTMSTPENNHISNPNFILVTIDGNEKDIQAGIYSVKDLKVKLGVPSEYELELADQGVLKPLDDNSTYHLYTPAIFISHVRCGVSS